MTVRSVLAITAAAALVVVVLLAVFAGLAPDAAITYHAPR